MQTFFTVVAASHEASWPGASRGACKMRRLATTTSDALQRTCAVLINDCARCNVSTEILINRLHSLLAELTDKRDK